MVEVGHTFCLRDSDGSLVVGWSAESLDLAVSDCVRRLNERAAQRLRLATLVRDYEDGVQ